MATALPVSMYLTVSSSMEQATGVVIDQTDDGQRTSRDFFVAPVYTISAKYTLVDKAAQDTLRAFFFANRNVELLVVLNDTNFACRVIGNLKYGYNGNGYSTLDVTYLGREM